MKNRHTIYEFEIVGMCLAEFNKKVFVKGKLFPHNIINAYIIVISKLDKNLDWNINFAKLVF